MLPFEFVITSAINIIFSLAIIIFFLGRQKLTMMELCWLGIHLLIVLSINSIIPPEYMPDQYKYLSHSNMIRDAFLYFDSSKLFDATQKGSTIFVASLLFAIFPMPFLSSVTVLAMINFLIFLVFYLSQIRPVVKNTNARLLFLAYPSLLFYSSIALRDTFIFIAMYLLVSGILLQRWGFLTNALYFFIKPLPYEARSVLQLVQSFENIIILGLITAVINRQIKNKIFFDKKILALNLFFFLSMVLYGYVVFNFGTAARYRFPFVALYLLIYQILNEKRANMLALQANECIKMQGIGTGVIQNFR